MNPSLHPEKQASTPSKDDPKDKTKKKNRWGLGRSKKIEELASEEEQQEANDYVSPRPAFYGYNKPTRRNVIPRDVAVPYFRFRKDRFYDWPPDPLVSRATPMLQTSSTPFDDDLNFSTHRSRDEDGDAYTTAMRQRRKRSIQ